MGALQPWHLIVILVIVLVVFGPGRLPELGKSLGEGMRELKKATSGDDAPATTQTPVAASSAPAAPVAAPVAAVDVAATRQCPSCNAAVPVSSNFCGSCGARVPTAEPVAAAPAQH